MQFANLNDFLMMGGYGLYVWLSFGVGLLSVMAIWLTSWLSKKQQFKQVISEQARQQRIKNANQQQVNKTVE